jgi:acetate kinase
MIMPDAILVLNAGSSSIKLAVFAVPTTEPALLCSGLLDEQDASHRLTIHDASGRTLFDAQRPADDGGSGLYPEILHWIETYLSGGRLLAVGHRIVHGGRDFFEPVDVTAEILEALAALTPLAPLHQPVCLAPIRAIAALRPGLPQIACFDTAFHHHLALPVSCFAIPRRFEEQGVRRYGFHGLSFEYIAGRLGEVSKALPGKRTVVAHLGNGASLCAMRDGKSVDTTMGLTPLDGLVMGTRCGAIDPGVLLYLQQEHKLSVAELQDLLYRQSGLLGVSGLSADMRVLQSGSAAAARRSSSSRSGRRARSWPWRTRFKAWSAWSSPAASASTPATSGARFARVCTGSACGWTRLPTRPAPNPSTPRAAGSTSSCCRPARRPASRVTAGPGSARARRYNRREVFTAGSRCLGPPACRKMPQSAGCFQCDKVITVPAISKLEPTMPQSCSV